MRPKRKSPKSKVQSPNPEPAKAGTPNPAPDDPLRDWLQRNAENIPAKNAQLLIKKLNSGRALSAAELKWLDEFHRGKPESLAPGPAEPTQLSYDSIAAAAAALGVDKAALRKAKRDGAPGFRGSRVYPAELLPWLAGASTKAPEDIDKEGWERRFLQVRVERQQFAFEVEKENYILATDAIRWTAEIVSEFAKVLDAIPSTLAPDIVGVPTIAEAELRIRAALEQAKMTLHQGAWGGPAKAGTTNPP